MPKTDGYKTREKILGVAEKLFSEEGFNGTSIEKIARAAGVNKGLIYYHFKDKKDLVVSILKSIISEIDQMVSRSVIEEDSEIDSEKLQSKIRMEIEYCQQRKRIISLMLMEALKSGGESEYLFKCAEMIMQQEMDGIKRKMGTVDAEDREERHRYLLHEFFTGFMPIISFVLLQEKWCDYFGCDRDKTLDYFIDSFTRTHLNTHLD